MSISPWPWTWDAEGDEPRDDRELGVFEPAGGTLYDANGCSIIQTDTGVYPPYGDDRNVIAAAPELLEALRGLQAIIESAESNASGNPEWAWVSPRVNAARAAIAKAEGRS